MKAGIGENRIIIVIYILIKLAYGLTSSSTLE
jgi:hypothetical protein